MASPTPPTRAHTITPFVTCGWCGKKIDAALPYCAHCGRRTEAARSGPDTCTSCGGTVRPGVDTFCALCGTSLSVAPLGAAAAQRTVALGSARQGHMVGTRLVLLDATGNPRAVYPLDRVEVHVGRREGEVRFPEDAYLSPLHAKFIRRESQLLVRDLGSRNGTWVFIEGPETLRDGDVLLIGAQILQFRHLGSPGPAPADADGTRRIGSAVPTPDVAMLTQLRPDGSGRDAMHLAAGRALVVGRDTGDWLFPYDQTMSGRHAEIGEVDGEFVVRDLGSRNGVAIAVRGERALAAGHRILLGDQLLRVDGA